MSQPPGSGEPPDGGPPTGPDQPQPQQPAWAPPPQPGWEPQPQPGWTPPPQQQSWTPPPPGQQPPSWVPPQQQPPSWAPPPQPGWAPSQQYGYGPGGWQQPPRRESRVPIIFVLVLVAGLIAAIVVAAILLGNSLGALTGGTTLRDVSVGQCFNGGRADGGTQTTIIRTVEIVDCATEHQSELAASVFYEDAPASSDYPGESTVSAYAEAECTLHFADYVGLPFSQSIYAMTYAYPLEVNWVLGDTSIQCIAHPPDGQATMTGSVRNSRR